MGRAGRSGEPSVCIFLHGRNQRLPQEMRPFFKGDRAICLRRALADIFTLTDTDGELDIDLTSIRSSTCSEVRVSRGAGGVQQCLLVGGALHLQQMQVHS